MSEYIKAPKGTKDVLPQQVYKWQFLEARFAEIARRAGFAEIRTPVFEHTELFSRGVGETTDVVEKQMYTFEDYAHRSITLRPEGTAGSVRAFVESNIYAEAQPTKLWYNISCFRYEKPQSGRLREFHQFGVEYFGSKDMIADTDVITVANSFLRSLGIKDLELRINSIGCPKCRPIYREALTNFFKPKYDELCDTCKSRFGRNPMRILDCKSPVCQQLGEGAPVMLDYLCDECKADFEELQADLAARGIAFTVDSGIVRGLDYYTKSAFEFVTNSIGAQGTVCGGGRYDNLIETLGGPDVPGVGFGLGIERLLMLLEANGIEIPAPAPPDAFVIYIGEDAKRKAVGLVGKLRHEGLYAELDATGRNTKNQFKYANKLGARYAVTIGDEELKSGGAKVKNMATGEEESVAFDDITGYIK
jgi:histidyl-tRNA synthetase